jgi:hypothetical protein
MRRVCVKKLAELMLRDYSGTKGAGKSRRSLSFKLTRKLFPASLGVADHCAR